MPDPVHDDLSKRPGSGILESDSSLKIEQLLLAGLDHYFRGRHERAIDIWSRVLFLDRSHARAHAYIDRARAAVAERLRESEELVYTGVAAFERGDVRSARSLLRSAVERGGGRDDALSILERLDRLEAAAGSAVAPHTGSEAIAPEAGAASERTKKRTRHVRVGPLIALGVTILGVVCLILLGTEWSPLGPNLSFKTQTVTATPNPIPVPAASELRIARSRRLAEAGDLREALTLLDDISIGDPLVDESDQLRARIQRKLLAPLLQIESTP